MNRLKVAWSISLVLSVIPGIHILVSIDRELNSGPTWDWMIFSIYILMYIISIPIYAYTARQLSWRLHRWPTVLYLLFPTALIIMYIFLAPVRAAN